MQSQQIDIFTLPCAPDCTFILHAKLVIEEDDLLATMTAVKRDPPEVRMAHKGVLGMKYHRVMIHVKKNVLVHWVYRMDMMFIWNPLSS